MNLVLIYEFKFCYSTHYSLKATHLNDIVLNEP